MLKINIICINCPEGAPEIPEEQYPDHMARTHGGGQISSLTAKRNIPKTSPQNLPPGINPEDLPSPEFMQTVAEMEKEAQKLSQPKPQEKNLNNPPFLGVQPHIAEKKIIPLELTYKFIGTDKEGHEVETLEIDKGDKHYVIAYCLIEKKQIRSRQLIDLNPEKETKE